MKAVEPLIRNEPWAKIWTAPFRDLGRSAPIAGHPSGTRPIGKVAQPVEIQRLRFELGVMQPLHHVDAVGTTGTREVARPV